MCLRYLGALSVALVWAGLASLANTAVHTRAVYVDSYSWPAADHGFGGFSGLELSADGQDFTAISDRGRIVSGQFVRDKGTIVDIISEPSRDLPDTQGKVQKDQVHDAEGLAIGADGRVFVSYENVHRVWAYDSLNAATALPSAAAFQHLQRNSGLEALAIDASGRLLAIPERSGRLDRPFPVYRFDKGTWSIPFTLPRHGGFLPVGADFGPDGLFYVLEREFSGLAFRSRVRRFNLTEKGAESEETLLETHWLRHGNLEGLSVWRDSLGDIRLTMISDDNFRRLQRTEFVEYRISQAENQ